MADFEDDPWNWDASRLARELCANTLFWDQSDPLDIPNLNALSVAIKARRLHGKILLTCGNRSMSLSDICNKLDIGDLSHQSSFIDTIPKLQSISPIYRKWKAQRASHSSKLNFEEDVYETFPGLYSMPLGLDRNAQGKNKAEISPAQRKRSASEELEKPPVKVIAQTNKRRMVPQNISAEPQRAQPVEIPTEADVISFRPVPSEDAAPGTYLGNGMITSADICGPGVAHLMETENPPSFWSVVVDKRPPPGRVLKVCRVIKRQLIKNGITLARLEGDRESFPAKEDSVRTSEEGLPLFGESDEEYDSDTYAEIQEEQAEREMAQREREMNEAAQRLRLTDDEVNAAIDKAVATFESNWAETKLPRLQSKANFMWRRARRRNETSVLINIARELIRRLQRRLIMLRRQILGQAWSSEDAVLKQAHSMEGSVQDLAYQSWFFGMLSQPKEPPKLLVMPPVLRPEPKRLSLLPEGEDADDDEELLTDEDAPEDSGFVIDDDDYYDDDEDYNDKETFGFLSGQAAYSGRLGKWGGASAVIDHHSRPNSDIFSLKSDDGGLVDLTMIDDSDDEGDNNRKDVGAARVGNEQPRADNVAARDGGGGDEAGSNGRSIVPASPIMVSLVASEESTLTPLPTGGPVAESVDSIMNVAVSAATVATATVPEEFTYSQLSDIAKQGYGYWETKGDVENLLINVLYRMDPELRMNVFASLAKSSGPDNIWRELIGSALERTDNENPSSPHPERDQDVAVGLAVARLFLDFINRQHLRARHRNSPLSLVKKREILDSCDRFDAFHTLLLGIVARFPKETVLDTWDSAESAGDALPADGDALSTMPAKSRVRNQAAADMRKRDKERQEEQAKRRDLLLQRLETSSAVPSDKSRLIINMSKDDYQGLVYVNEQIAARIKDHQIEGVRFMWNQITVDAENRQGCLLAHTMGLGKTMQIITLLVAIVETAQSLDPSMSSQVPTDLAVSKTIVLCPTGLVDNWMDELLMWAPPHLLGSLYKVASATKIPERRDMVARWRDDGGVLVIGYDLFRIMVEPDDEISKILVEEPNLVVADEAHLLKNKDTGLRKAAEKFRTHSRIAMTGSPLANHVGEYWTMIDWVAPNYLGPYTEFDHTYQKPIENGLWGDSTQEQKRSALRTLLALTKVVGPKMHRATMRSTAREADMPRKTELLITVPLTEMQRRLYDCYVTWAETAAEAANGIAAFAIRNNLILICNHPKTYHVRCDDARLNKKRGNHEEEKSLDGPPLIEGLKLAKVVRDLDDASHSWKTRLLLRIVEQCKGLKDRVLVFTHSIITLNYLELLFRMHQMRVCRLDGQTKVQERQSRVKSFNQGDEYDVFLISSMAGSVGFNITGANRVVLFDSKYNPVHEQQAVGRAYRMGQEKPVYVYRFMCGGTDEEALHNQSVYKIQLSARVVDKSRPMPRSTKRRNREVFTRVKQTPQKPLGKFRGIDSVMDGLLDDVELAQGIRNIVEMDTFEEQELESLTEADRIEADRMAELSKLRRTMVVGVSSSAEMMVLPPSQSRMHTSFPSSHPHHPPPQVPPFQVATPQTRVPLPTGLPSSPYKSATTYTTNTTMTANGLQGPTTGSNIIQRAQTGNPLVPISGANTGFRGQDGVLPPSSSSNNHARAAGNGLVAKADFESRLVQRLEELEREHESNQGGWDVSQLTRGDAAGLARMIADEIEKQRRRSDLGELANNNRWPLLRGLLAGAGFVMAVSSGRLAPERLARARDSELRREADLLGSSTRADLDQRMNGRIGEIGIGIWTVASPPPSQQQQQPRQAGSYTLKRALSDGARESPTAAGVGTGTRTPDGVRPSWASEVSRQPGGKRD